MRYQMMEAIYPGVSQIYTPRHSVHFCYPCISVHLPLTSPFLLSLYLRTPAIAQSSAKLSGGGGEKRIFLPQQEQSYGDLDQSLHPAGTKLQRLEFWL